MKKARIALTLAATILGSTCGPVAFSQESIEPDARIIDGTPTTIKDHKWQVVMYVTTTDKINFCSGSIIAARWLVTAAHCFDGDTQTTHVRIKVGVTNFETEGVWKYPTLVLPHPGYDPKTYENDIALVQLEDDYSSLIVPMADETTSLRPSMNLEIAGWGVTVPGGPLSEEMRQASVPYVSNDTCKKSYGDKAIFDTMLCAGKSSGGADSCQGDSGGPLVVRDHGDATLVGIVSHGDGCARKLRYGLYTRVSSFQPWISREVLKPRTRH
jgi:trypsin